MIRKISTSRSAMINGVPGAKFAEKFPICSIQMCHAQCGDCYYNGGDIIGQGSLAMNYYINHYEIWGE